MLESAELGFPMATSSIHDRSQVVVCHAAVQIVPNERCYAVTACETAVMTGLHICCNYTLQVDIVAFGLFPVTLESTPGRTLFGP